MPAQPVPLPQRLHRGGEHLGGCRGVPLDAAAITSRPGVVADRCGPLQGVVEVGAEPHSARHAELHGQRSPGKSDHPSIAWDSEKPERSEPTMSWRGRGVIGERPPTAGHPQPPVEVGAEPAEEGTEQRAEHAAEKSSRTRARTAPIARPSTRGAASSARPLQTRPTRSSPTGTGPPVGESQQRAAGGRSGRPTRPAVGAQPPPPSRNGRPA